MKQKKTSRFQISNFKFQILLIVLMLLILEIATPDFSFAQTANEITANVRIEGPSATIVHQNVAVPENCAVTDSAGRPHAYTGYRAVCALQVLQEQGKIAYRVTDYGFALALDQINDIVNAPDWSQTWFLRDNNAVAEVGIDGLALSAKDEFLLSYGPWPFPAPLKVMAQGNAENIGSELNLSAQIWSDATGQFVPYSSAVTFYVNNLANAAPLGKLTWSVDSSPAINIRVEASGAIRSAPLDLSGKNTASNIGTMQTKNTFEVDRGADFLIRHQNNHGAISDSAMVNDWAALALASQNYNQEARDKIKSYLLTNPPAGDAVTDSLRRAMALMSLYVNPYDVAGFNYIQPIIDGFDGANLGKKEFINEEVFALLVLRRAGFGLGEKIVAALTGLVMAAQQDNGSWADSTDMTAAAIQALLTVRNLGDVETALERAEVYLRQQQTDYGGFNNSEFSTAWAIQAIAALGKSEADWYKNSLTPGEFLGGKQAEDGGMSELLPLETRLWATALVIPAAQNKSWLQLLAEFPKGQIRKPQTTAAAPSSTPATSLEIIIATSTEADSSAASNEEPPPTSPAAEAIVALEATNTDSVHIVVPIFLETPTSQATSSVATKTTDAGLESEPELNPKITLTAAPALSAQNPIQKNAKSIFQAAATLTTTLGAYLAWRLLQTIT